MLRISASYEGQKPHCEYVVTQTSLYADCGLFTHIYREETIGKLNAGSDR